MGLLLRGWFGDRAAFLRQNRETSNGAGWRFLRASEVAELVTRSGSHFFEPDTLRWFGGKVHDCYGGVDGAVYIVTSEQDKPRQPKRLYTVRRLDLVSCEIEEPEQGGGFQGCATLDVARRRAKRIAAGEPVDQRRGMKATTESEARP